VFPLALQRLFPEVGFGWAVRITGFICLACCLLSFACCSSRLPPRKPGPLIDLSSFRDLKFMTFTLGSCIVTLGQYRYMFFVFVFSSSRRVLTVITPDRTVRPVLLPGPVRRGRSSILTWSGVRYHLGDECRLGCRASHPGSARGYTWMLQPQRAEHAHGRLAHAHDLADVPDIRIVDVLCRILWGLLWCPHRA
jgi:hypothetical protein